ncbi:hypothetical protein TW95_gp1686 [Pandoravirus inopinatum]|uniref:Uncharacterized protein n=1 Tax=Pandoravirus inopinatum TaxID=1605721 RepID=A0A0B5J8Y1_9VIRU|nr:hypothetical protein TW95_gp1686 [Pandoravirus inopinatum]AJF98420.1 hypothetical protein [Pandoravirus inopinatum]
MSALSAGAIPPGFFGGRSRVSERGQPTPPPYDAFAAIDPLGDDDDDRDDNGDDSSTSSISNNNYSCNDRGDRGSRNDNGPMDDRNDGGAAFGKGAALPYAGERGAMYGDGRTRRRHSTDRGRRTDPRARDAYFGCVADVPTAADDLRGMPIEPDAGPSRFGCPGPVQADRRARFADGFGGVSRDMRRAPSSVGPVTAPVASPLAPFERPGMSSSSRTGRDHQAELVDARRAYVEAMDRLSERQRAYQVEREERIRQMDAQANLVMAPLREAAADAEDKMRAAARSLQRQFDRRLVELEADRTLTREERAMQRAAVERARAVALHPDDAYERRQREASSTAGLLSMVDSLLGGLMGGGGAGAPFVTVRMVPSDASMAPPLPPSTRRMAGPAPMRAPSPTVTPSVRIEEID